MKRSLFVVLSVLVALSMLLTACQPAATPTEAEKPTEAAAPAEKPAAGQGTVVRVATEAAYPPFEMVRESDKQLEGFDIDLMNAIAEKAGFKVEYANTPFDSVIAGISTCQFDAAISAITITDERKQKIAFSDPYINAGQITTVRVDNNDIKGPADLKGKTIGVQLSTTGQIEAEKIEGATIKPYDTVDLAFLDLKNGQVDAVVADYPTTLAYVNKMKDSIKTTGDIFTEESYGVAICKQNTELLNKVNKALGELKSEGKIKDLEKKWLAASGTAEKPAGDAKTIRVATEAAYPPFEMVRESDKELEGFDIELMNAIAEKAGFKVEYANTPFDSVIAGISTCQFDAAISAITITDERKQKIGFSDPYINAGQITTVRVDNNDIKGPADLKGKTIGVQLSTTGQIEAEKIEGATIKPYDTVDLAFLDLKNGQVDAVVADYPTTLNYVNKMKDSIKTTGDIFTQESYGIAVCKQNTELLDQINKALAELKSEGKLKELETKWLAAAQ